MSIPHLPVGTGCSQLPIYQVTKNDLCFQIYRELEDEGKA